MKAEVRTERSSRFARVALVAVGSLMLASVSAVSAPAHAAAPANDNWRSATRVTGLPFRTTVDTTQATTDSVVAPGSSASDAHSVWYHVKLKGDGPIFVTTRGSNFTHRLRMYHADSATQAPSQWDRMGGDVGYPNDPAAIMRELKGGQHYYVMISSDDNAPGGLARLVLRRPAKIAFTLAKYGKYDPVDGSAVIHGTIKSTRPATVRIGTTLRQLVGTHIVQGFGRTEITAKAAWSPWRLRVVSGQTFKVGPARVSQSSLAVFDLGVYVGTYHFVRGTVTLR